MLVAMAAVFNIIMMMMIFLYFSTIINFGNVFVLLYFCLLALTITAERFSAGNMIKSKCFLNDSLPYIFV